MSLYYAQTYNEGLGGPEDRGEKIMSIKTVTQIRRLRNSTSGNPRWKVVFDDGVAAYTSPDSALALDFDPDWVGQPVRATFEQQGIVNVLTGIEPA